MEYFKIYSKTKKAWWTQDRYGYTDEYNAGFWPVEVIAKMGLDDTQKFVPFVPGRITQALIENGLYDFGVPDSYL